MTLNALSGGGHPMTDAANTLHALGGPVNRPSGGSSAYGAAPHGSEAVRVEGYPSAPAMPREAPTAVGQATAVDQAGCINAGRIVGPHGPSYRHEKPEVLEVQSAPFLPGSEKSLIESTPYTGIHRM